MIYDTDAHKAEVRGFGEDYDAAQAAYEEAERQTRDMSNFDVVLLSADSEETIRRTHSSYFNDGASLESLLPAGALD